MERAAHDTVSNRHLMIGAALGTLCSVWTAVYLVTFKMVSGTASPMTLVAIMLCGAALANTIVSLFVRRHQDRDRRITIRTVLIISLCTVIGNIAVLAGLKRIDAAVASVIFQLQIFMIAGLERLLMQQRISKATILGAMIAVVGFVIMNAPGLSAMSGQQHYAGMAYTLIAASTFAVMLVVTRHAIQQISVVEVNLWRLWISALVVLAWPGVIPEMLTLDIKTCALTAASGVAGLVLGRLTLMNAVRFISATTTKLLTLSTPIFACLLAWLSMNTIPSSSDIIGSLIILAGVAVPLIWAQLRNKEPTATNPSTTTAPDAPSDSPSNSTH